MRTITLLNRPYSIHDKLSQFNVNVGTNPINFFGSNPNSSEMFFQFENGSTYIYKGITPEVRKQMWASTSLGSFVAKNIIKKFPSEKLIGVGVIEPHKFVQI